MYLIWYADPHLPPGLCAPVILGATVSQVTGLSVGGTGRSVAR